jgi:hypothetical protein
MGKKKKKKRRCRPRRLRMNRKQRLSASRHWLATERARTPIQIARAYRRHYGVDWECAIRELALLGVALDRAWVTQLRALLEGNYRARAQRRTERERLDSGLSDEDSDEYFAYIAGYTRGGAPYGVAWEEWRQIEAQERGGAALNTSAARVEGELASRKGRNAADLKRSEEDQESGDAEVPFKPEDFPARQGRNQTSRADRKIEDRKIFQEKKK